MEQPVAIKLEGLTKSYGKTKVLKGVDLTVPKGSVLALLGPNGAGKTTTIRILSTLVPYDDGVAQVNGFDVKKEGQKVRESIGLTGQYAAVDEFLTGIENLEMMGRLYRLPQAVAASRARDLLERFDLADAGSQQVKTYSGGMRRKLDLAASLIAAPPVVFLDEPTTGLDPRSRLAMWEIIKELVRADITILLTTQYLEEADVLADTIAVVDHGKIIAQGTAESLKREVGQERLELVMPTKKDYARATQLVREDGLHWDEPQRTVSIVASGGIAQVTRVLGQFERAGIEIETFALRKPTLDDVFLQLTGKAIEEEPANNDQVTTQV